MRKLASIRSIDEIKPIPGADNICAYRVNEWWVVDKINAYKLGDLVIYCEVDSWIPHELAPFLSRLKEPRDYNGVRGQRLRTVKLRGQISQGLLLPISSIISTATTTVSLGDDVGELLGIQKWEAPIPASLAGLVKAAWPHSVPKTDQERVQNLDKEWLSTLVNFSYEVTEKLEGSSMTVALINGEFIVCSRNLNLKESQTNSFWQQARRYNIEDRLRKLNLDNIVIQGELIGENVQGNYYGVSSGHDFYVYDIYDLTQNQYLKPQARRSLTNKLMLKHVPVICKKFSIKNLSIDTVIKQADGVSLLMPQKPREGLVFKARINPTYHFKAVSNAYLLKYG